MLTIPELPVTVRVAVPFAPPKQVTFVELILDVTPQGSDPISALYCSKAEHPLASLKSTIQVPGERPTAVVPTNPAPHVMLLYGAVPPEITTVAVPLLNPQFASVFETTAESGVG
jgi:hypothetical protein